MSVLGFLLKAYQLLHAFLNSHPVGSLLHDGQEHRRDVTREAKVIFEAVDMCEEHGWAQQGAQIMILANWNNLI